jgi:hypothetical protein
MKKAIICLALALIALGVCAAQNTAATQKQLVGAWIDPEGTLWIFGADGKVIIDAFDTTYAVTGAQVQVVGRSNAGLPADQWIDYPMSFDLALSADGKTITLSGNYSAEHYTPRFNSPLLKKIEIDQTLNGTWILEMVEDGKKMKWENTYNNGVFEVVYNGLLNMRGLYTTENGKINIKTTHHFNRDARKWYNVSKAHNVSRESFTENYSIRGKKLTLKDEDGVPREFTKK